MKKLTVFLGIFLLVAVVGSHTYSAKAKAKIVFAESMLGCELSPSEIDAIQIALAEYNGWADSYVVAHTIAVSAKVCDGEAPVAGTITLDLTEENQVWNWERRGGGSNIIVIWPT
jgi:hypothetical protein